MTRAIGIAGSIRGPTLALAFGIGLLSLSGCGSTSTFQDPAYTHREFTSGPVAFIPMRFTEIGMEAYEEFRKAFKGEPEGGGETKLANAFNRAFLDAVKAKVKDIRILDSGPERHADRHPHENHDRFARTAGEIRDSCEERELLL